MFSFVELLILYERWAGERLVLEMSVPKSRRLYRPISVSAVPAGPSIDIRRSCRFLGAMFRALGDLPGGLGRFLPCRAGANHCRLRSIGWESVTMVSRLGLWKLLMPAFLMTYFLSLDILLGPVSLSLMVLFGCGIALLICLTRSLLGGCRTPSMTKSSSSSRAQGWRGRWEFDSQVFCHT